MRRGLSISLTLALLSGCDAPATQLVVLVDTDLAVNEELAGVSVVVLDGAGQEVSAQDFALADDGATPGPASFAMPLSFAVVPVGDDPSRRVTVQVSGLAPSGSTIVSRRAVTGFIEEEQLLLPMFLSSACRDVTCPAEQTCTERGCVDERVPPQSLPAVRPGDEVRLDSAIAPRDGGPDGARADAGTCDEVVPCNGACACATGCCEMTCESSPCSPSCGNGDTCSIVTGPEAEANVTCMRSTCEVDARNAATVTVDCMLSSCAVDCTGAESCVVACAAGATCVLSCAEAASCSFSGCTGAVTSCAADVLACRTECP